MKKIDLYAVEEIGIGERKLMEIAGMRISELIAEKFEPQKVRVLAGKGNNGGDGLAAARKLYELGFEPVVSVIGEPRQIPDEELQIIENIGIQTVRYDQEIISNIVIDSIFGYSLKGDPRDPYNSVIRNINDSSSEIVSVDVPTGLNPETGEMADPNVVADYVLSLAAPKKGVKNIKAESYLADIGIPRLAYQNFGFEKPEEFKQKSIFRLEK